MKIKTLELINFRQLSGKIIMSTDRRKNMTVIHGENGAGKTSILNAFKWCFYGHTDFETGERKILNEHAIVTTEIGKYVTVSVVIEFNHEEKSYTARRTQKYRKKEGLDFEEVGGTDFHLSWIDESGNYKESMNPVTHMDQILPERMQSYFFFNGEKIERLSSARSGNEISDAIKNLMGIEIIERAANHLLKNVTKSFKQELKRNSHKELAAVVEKEVEAQEQVETIIKQLSVTNRNIKEINLELEAIGHQLEANKDTVKLEVRRKKIQEGLSRINNRLSEIVIKRKDTVNSKGFLAFVKSAKNQVKTILADNRKKGQLPSKIRRQFVEDLLEDGRCICSRPLKKGDMFYKEVESLKQDAGNEELDGAVIDTAADMHSMTASRSSLYEMLETLRDEEEALTKQKNVLNGELDVLGEQTKKVEDAAALQERRSKLQKKCVQEIERTGRLKHDKSCFEKKLVDLGQEIKRLSKMEEKHSNIQKKLDLANELGLVAKEFHGAAAQATRKELSKQVNEIFQNIMKKDYWAEIDEEYDLQIYKNVHGYGKQVVFEKSTGENQITSLSFIGSLVSIARKRNKEGRQYFQGGIFPIVMDSPYGQLDDVHKKMVAKYIPELAEQVILMVTSSQWKGAVEAECSKYVGTHVSLIHNAPSVIKESVYSKSGSEFEYTDIEEGYRG